MDGLVSDYLEFLWAEGEGRALTSNFLAALQDRDPKFKGQLPLSWRLVPTWTSWQFHMTLASEPAVISLGFTKSGKRQGAAESITISELTVLQLPWRWKQNASTHEFLTEKPPVWRDAFVRCLKALELETWGFRPYS